MNGTNTNVTIRMDTEVKKECESIFGALGMNLSTAINVFLRKSIRTGGFPFDVRLDEKPNAETIAAMKEAERIARDPNATKCNNIKALFEELSGDDS